ncbi:MAG: alpha/beta fold hydrolase [Legionella sp.]
MKINLTKYGNGFPIVFFHGWGFDSQIWLSLRPQLQDNYQLILVDLPGFGCSSLMEWDDFKETLINQLPQKFIVLGWSLGGLYAMRLATEVPDKIEHLINVTSSPRFVLDELWPGVSQDVFKRFYKRLSVDFEATLNEFLELQGLSIKEELNYKPHQLTSAAGLELGMKILETWDLRQELKQFKKPASFMFGRLDPIVSVRTMNCMQQTYPDFNYVLFKRAAHMPFLSHPQLFIEELKGLIQ